MDLTKLSKSELLMKCEELGFIKCKSKNKYELINLINTKLQIKNQEKENEIIIDENDNEIIINNNVSYFNIDILNFITLKKFDLIYLDPPYETNRTFTLNSLDDEIGFQDLWEDNKYIEWIDKLIKHLELMLSKNGTLVFHISSENSFIAESVLRKNLLEKMSWKKYS